MAKSPIRLLTGACGLLLAVSGGALAGSITLGGAGATFPAPLYERWAEAFHAKQPEVAVGYERVGSGEGIARFLAGGVDFGASDVPPTPEESAQAEDGMVLVPATAGMVVLAYNLPGLHGELRLPTEVYAGIFAGAVQDWDDPAVKEANPGLSLPHRTIAVVARLEASGTTQTFTAHLNAASHVWAERKLGVGRIIAWPAATMQVRGNEGVAARIRISDWSIGYVEYGFAKRLGLPMAVLRNAENQYVSPTEQSGTAALLAGTARNGGDPRIAIDDPPGHESYPIVTYSWLLLRQHYADAEKAKAVQAFVRFGLGEGQAMGEALGYLPLPPTVTAKALAAVDTIR